DHICNSPWFQKLDTESARTKESDIDQLLNDRYQEAQNRLKDGTWRIEFAGKEILPSARELVRDERQDAQDRRLVSRAIPLRGSGSPCPSDKKARTIDPHRTGMEIHHACHRRPSDYHQPRPRPQGRSGLVAAAVAGDVPARAVPGRAPPRPDRGVRPS